MVARWTISISTYQAVFHPWQSISELQVPAGAGVKDGNKKTDLLYNEYIVYDVAQVHPNLWSAVSKPFQNVDELLQVQAKYLLQMKFNYKT